MNGLFGGNLSADAAEVRCASRGMDPYLGVTPGGRSVETRTQASDWDASLSGTHCNHSRPTFPAFNHLPRSDDRLLGGTDNLRSGSALYRRFSTGAPLRERQHHPHLGRQPGHEPDPGPGDVLTPVIGYGARKQAAFAPRASHHGLRQPVVWAAA